ncbi:MAG: DUF4382 domain-containing protein [Nitrospirota bacterium]|nr:DUF4382 domain-containing protein [Nitrospirota bacterium]MDH5768242.1 DUF4382 domain-containing protein [Nitrospirota bacterium]
MKKKIFCFYLVFAIAIFLSGCGGGGGGNGSGSSGTVSMNIADAKPMLPPGTEHVFITFDEVSVHKAGGEWTSLPLAKTPYTIDLLQFSDGKSTQLVPPVTLESGKYTQIRIGVTSAEIWINGVPYPVNIPSDKLRTDKEFEFNVIGGGAVNLTVDFDLSQSIVVTGSGTYQLKPVLHIIQTQEAATIQGSIKASTFGSFTEAVVIVIWDKDNSGTVTAGDEEYTRIRVEKGSDPTPFSIYWLVPNQSYIIQIEIGGSKIYEEFVVSTKLQAGAVFLLNSGSAI